MFILNHNCWKQNNVLFGVLSFEEVVSYYLVPSPEMEVTTVVCVSQAFDLSVDLWNGYFYFWFYQFKQQGGAIVLCVGDLLGFI